MDRDAPWLPQPCPSSPPEYPDLYGRRREFAKVQMLESEIGFLREELKSVEGFQPASRCCKEYTSDWFSSIVLCFRFRYKKHSASCGFWKWLCGISWLNFSCICYCCYAVCPPDLKLPCRCTCDSCIHIPERRCSNCLLRKWPFFSCCHCPDCSKPNGHCRNCNCNCILSCPCCCNSSCCCCCCHLCFSCNGLCL